MTDIFFQQADIEERRRQYKAIMMSKNPKVYYIETLDMKTGEWSVRMDHHSAVHLAIKGRAWVKGKFADDYRITKK